MRKSYKKYFARIIFATLTVFCLLALVNGVAKADNYGSGPYGSCPYQSNCQHSTVVKLPVSGLLVDTNLHDGQVIPWQGYNILVTPLNGSGTSFKQVDFYINGELIHSQQPDKDGTVMWFWKPENTNDTVIKIVVTGQDNESVTQIFHVTIAKSASAATVLPKITKTVPTTNFIRRLPKIIKEGLPYLLFLILAADILLVLTQIRHELHEYHVLETLLIREQNGSKLKKTLSKLLSHYLRTPITVIAGGIDLGRSEGVPESLATTMNNDIHELNLKTSNLIEFSESAVSVIPQSGADSTEDKYNSWSAVLFPVLLVGTLAFAFEYLVQRAGNFSISQISLAFQVTIFSSLAILLYVVARRLEVRRRDVHDIRCLLQAEVAFNQKRDTLIDKTATELRTNLNSLDAHIAQMAPTSKAISFIRDGQKRLHDVVYKCEIARLLKGATCTTKPTSVQLNKICALSQTLDNKARSKDLSIDIDHDISFTTQNPDLLSYVMYTLLDNAIEYSPAHSHIEVTTNTSDAGLTISVIDHGQGVPKDKYFRLFQAFSKVDGAEHFNHEGAGLSLYLDKLIMTYLNGNIAMNTSPESGTNVILSLPNGLTTPE